jgi:hypothetical protein
MQPVTQHSNHPQPTQWSLGMGMFSGIEEIRRSLDSGTGQLKLGFTNHSLAKEAGR